MGDFSTDFMVSINGGAEVSGSLTEEQEWCDVTSLHQTKPDMKWEFRDDAGHFHAYDREGKLPTLVERLRHVNCDGSEFHSEEDCGGYSVAELFCQICDVQVEPKRLPDHEPKTVPGRRSWTLKVDTEVPRGQAVSVRAVAPNGAVFFGVAAAFGSVSISKSSGDRVRVTTELHGTGPLGVRNRPGVSVAAGVGA